MRRVQLRGKQRSRAVRAQREQHHIARADRRMPRPRDGVLRALALAIAIVTCPTVASAVPQALHVSQAFLSADTSSSRARGRIDVEAVLREEAGGTLATALVAGQTTITVEDGGGFTFTRVVVSQGARSLTQIGSGKEGAEDGRARARTDPAHRGGLLGGDVRHAPVSTSETFEATVKCSADENYSGRRRYTCPTRDASGLSERSSS